MTPAIKIAKQKKIPFTVHEYTHDPANKSYGEEAALKLGVPADHVFKTLVVTLDNKELAVAIIPVTQLLSLKLMAKACDCKKVTMAPKADVERTTGYVLGGVSPLGQKKRLKTVIDSSAEQLTTIFVSAGKRGLEIELSPDDLALITQASMTSIQQ